MASWVPGQTGAPAVKPVVYLEPQDAPGYVTALPKQMEATLVPVMPQSQRRVTTRAAQVSIGITRHI